MSKKILALSGGGVRIYGAIGALYEAECQGIDLHQFDIITATSAGSIVGLLLANGKSAKDILDIARKMPLNKFIDKGFIGEKLLINGLNNEPLAKWADSFNFPPSEKLLINAFDKKINKQIVFDKTTFSAKGYGYALKCATRLPGAMTPVENRYQDGGMIENPLIMFADPDDQILCINLGYAGETPDFNPTLVNRLNKTFNLLERIEDITYALDYKNYEQFKFMIDRFNNIDVVSPKIYNIRSSDFWVTNKDKEDMIQRGRDNTRDQWSSIKTKWS